MKYFTMNKNVGLSVLMGCVLMLSACATGVGGGASSRIEQRVTQRLQALLSGDLAAAYEYLSPGYRSSVSSLQYQRSLLLRRVGWDNASYVDSDCEGNVCSVRISVDYSIRGALPGVKSFDGTQEIKESWVLVDQQWYLVPKK